MSILRRIFGKLSSATHKYDVEMYQAHLSIQTMRLLEEATHTEALKSIAQKREEREIKSGIVIDPGGTCLCKRCGHTVSALYDHCDNCNANLDWNI